MSGNGSSYRRLQPTHRISSIPTPRLFRRDQYRNRDKTGMVVTATLSFSYQVPTYFMKVIRLQQYHRLGLIHSELYAADLHQFLSDARCLRLHELPVDASEQTRLMAVNPDNNTRKSRLSAGLPVCLPFPAQGACAQSGTLVYQGPIPAVGHSYAGYEPNPSPGGYCQGFTISRLGNNPRDHLQAAPIQPTAAM